MTRFWNMQAKHIPTDDTERPKQLTMKGMLMKDTNQENKTNNSTDNLEHAVKIVQAAILAREDEYKKISLSEEQDPILIEGRTQTGYVVSLMVDPKDVAQVFLDYDYATWDILEGEALQGMWDRLAKIYGLESVYFVDL